MIDPSKATPQAPLGLRAASTGAPKAGEGDDEEDDGPPSSEKPDAMGDHEPLRAAAEEAHTKAAEAYGACKGSDSAALLMAADDAGDAATEAHAAAKASSMKLRGVEEAPPSSKRPGAPPAVPAAPGARLDVHGLARAIAAQGGTADAQAKTLAAVGFSDRMLALFGGASLEETEGLARAAFADASDAKQLRAAAEKTKALAAKRAESDAETALRAEVTAAVTARKFTRAELADDSPIAPGGWTPKAYLREMTAKSRASMFASKQARAVSAGDAGGPLVPDETPMHISAAVRDYAARRGITDPAAIAKLAAAIPSNGAPAPQEAP